jgi:hypothetical protein
LAAALIAMPLAVVHDAVSSSVSSQSRLSILGADVSTLLVRQDKPEYKMDSVMSLTPSQRITPMSCS